MTEGGYLSDGKCDRVSLSSQKFFVPMKRHFRSVKGEFTMVRIAVCVEQSELSGYIRQLLEAQYAGEICIHHYADAQELAADYSVGRTRNVADILLMDLDSNGIDGIDVVAGIQERFSQLKVIFISGHLEYAEEIFRVNPNNFLVKPIAPTRFLAAVERARKQLEQEDKDCFVITVKGNSFKIRISDILYFESEKRTVILHGRFESYTIYRKLDDVQAELPDSFLRCHQSYLVNMNEIRSLKPLRLELYHGEEIPVSRPKYRETKERFLAFLGQSPEGKEPQ